MFKLVVLSCLVAAAFGGLISAPASYAYEKTIVEPHVSVVETPTINHVGSVVKTFPSAHSYQSQTQYHSKTVAEPIYAHGVEKKVISTPIVKKIVEHVPAVVPVAKVVAEPYYAKSYVAEPYYAKAVVAEPAYSYAHAAPLAYSAPIVAPKAYGYAHAAYPAAYSTYSLPAASYAHHW